jgi:hypothetical protein
MTQEVKDLAVLRKPKQTVGEAGADSTRAPGGRSATLERTVQKTQQNLQYLTSKNGRSAPCPRIVHEQQVPRGQSMVSRRTVRPARGRSGTPTRTV